MPSSAAVGSTAAIETSLGMCKCKLGQNAPSLACRLLHNELFQENGPRWKRIARAAEMARGKLRKCLYPANPEAFFLLLA